MKIVSFAPLAVGPLVWQAQASEWSVTVIVKATFWLVHGGEATLADEQEPLLGDRHFADDPGASLYASSDWAPIKPRADVVLVGHAYAPEGAEVSSLTARLQVGGLSKSLLVSGDRVWEEGPQGPVPSAPAPFTRMPISYELAAHGPDNPVGLHVTGQVVAGAHALPNLEAAVPQGAPGFGPVAASWRSRRGLLDERGARWSERLNGPAPEGFDYGFYNAAPADQQVELLRMGSTIRLENLHPDLPVFETRLPAIRPRAYVVTPGRGAREVFLRADTLWIAADQEGATVTFRGLVAVDARDVETGIVATVLESQLDPQPSRYIEPLLRLTAAELEAVATDRAPFVFDPETSSIVWDPDTTTGLRELSNMERGEVAVFPRTPLAPEEELDEETRRSTLDALRTRMRESGLPFAQSQHRIGPTSRTLDRPLDAPRPALPFQDPTKPGPTKAHPLSLTQEIRHDAPLAPATPFEQAGARARDETPATGDDALPSLVEEDTDAQTLSSSRHAILPRASSGPLRLGASPLGGSGLGGEPAAEAMVPGALAPPEMVQPAGAQPLREGAPPALELTPDESTSEDPTRQSAPSDVGVRPSGATEVEVSEPLADEESTNEKPRL